MTHINSAARRLIAGILLAAGTVSALSAQPITPSATALQLQESFSSVADYYRTRVVSITAAKTVRSEVPQYQFYYGDPFEQFFQDYFGGTQRPRQQAPRYRERVLEGGGTGVVIDEKGYVLTNYHVVNGADEVRVHFGTDDTETYPAEVAGTDPYTDLAVLKIKAKKKFPAAPLGDSGALKVGDWVIAIGSPFGLGQTVTAGIVSARRQSMIIEDKRYDDLIQTDAAINRGNSGGPLVNIRGEVIGVNTAIFAPTGVFSGVGFAIPINQASDILKDLIEKGAVKRGWLGVELKDVDAAIAKQFGLSDEKGVLVNAVVNGAPAAKGGVRRGDIITSINGQKVTNASDLRKIVQSLKPGAKAHLLVTRDNVVKAMTITLESLPDDTAALSSKPDARAGAGTSYEWNGVTVEPVTPQTRRMYALEDGTPGVVVTAVTPDALDTGLREGDLITGINRALTPTLDAFKAAARKASPADGIVFDILRRGVPVYITYQRP